MKMNFIFNIRDRGIARNAEIPKKSGSGTVEVSIHRLRDERLPKGPQFASESLDADTASVSVFPKLTHYQKSKLKCGAPEFIAGCECYFRRSLAIRGPTL